MIYLQLKKTNYILPIILTSVIIACEEKKVVQLPSYNEKANSLLEQVIIDQSYHCDCVLEIPDESLIEINQRETPGYQVKKIVVEKLNLTSEKSLDSLDKQSINFVFDRNLPARHNLKLINVDSLKLARYDAKICPKGILCLKKPIFDKNYQTAVVDYQYAGMCLPQPLALYKFNNNKWVTE